MNSSAGSVPVPAPTPTIVVAATSSVPTSAALKEAPAAETPSGAEEDEEEELALKRKAEEEEEAHIAALQRALSLPEFITRPTPLAAPPLTPEQPPPLAAWPPPLDDVKTDQAWPNLSATGPEVEAWIHQHNCITIRTVTWNLAANKPPPVEDILVKLLPLNKYHVYVVGTEECERSIAASALNTSKRQWEEYLTGALGKMYVPLRAHTLQAIHIMLFVHTGIAHLCSDITSAAVATGIANTLGNKGGVAISMRIAGTKFVFANAHLAAHQNAVKQRNAEFEKLRKELPVLLAKKERSSAVAPSVNSSVNVDYRSSQKNTSSSETDSNFKSAGSSSERIVHVEPTELNSSSTSPSATPPLEHCADRVVFMGDLNYRVRGNRVAVDQLLLLNMHDVMLANDQLKWSMQKGLALVNFVEPPLNFRPTYKLDFLADTYDSGAKQRIPAWTDRILYVDRGMQCVAYNADFALKTSDHRPVYASFFAQLALKAPAGEKEKKTAPPPFSKESQVCSLQ